MRSVFYNFTIFDAVQRKDWVFVSVNVKCVAQTFSLRPAQCIVDCPFQIGWIPERKIGSVCRDSFVGFGTKKTGKYFFNLKQELAWKQLVDFGCADAI